MVGNTSQVASSKALKKIPRSLVIITLITSLAISLSAFVSTSPMAQAATSSSQGIYTPINPTRVCDTRIVQAGVASNQCNTNGNGTLSSGSTLQVQVAGQGSIPTNATGVVVNVTATNTTSSGYLTIYPTGATKPNSSSINFTANESIPNLIEVALGSNGDLSIYNFMGSTDVMVDVEGYVAPPASQTTAGQFVSLAPSRICDTRIVQVGVVSNQCNTNGNGTLSTGSTLQVKVAGLAGIPNGASAVVANVTATNTTSSGYLTAFPGPSLPTASNLNFGIGQSVANRVIVPINSNGDISIYNFLGSVDVIVDINGYYTGSSSATTGSFFTGTTPSRICDTRAIQVGVVSNQCNTNGNGTLGSNSSMNVQVVGLDSIPANASAVVINVTTTNSVSGGFFTLYPQPSSPTNPPVVSDLNWAPGETRANLAIVKVGVNNSITLYSLSRADLIIDVMGYYSPPLSTIPIPTVTSISPNSGPNTGGTRVTITGTGFSGATSVDFGTTSAASFTVNSDSQITATSPSGSTGTVDVTVTTIDGTSAISTGDSFTFSLWQISAVFPPVLTVANGIICPSTTECFAYGYNGPGLNSTDSTGEIFGTTDSGATWTIEPIPTGINEIFGITCLSTAECFAYGKNILNANIILGTTDSGATWTTETIPSGTYVHGFTCQSNPECFAYGFNYTSGQGVILATTDLGATWTTESIPTAINDVYGMTCPSATECFANGLNSSNAGVILVTTDLGATWTTESIPTAINDIYGMTCPSATECFAYGLNSSNAGVILATTDSG
ncbi:MAG: hypothetical protein HKL80_00005, partial [Acidimicrobiales bacterium]|nr:hypothetical protein [Acidimicrobiales bacterium]